MTDKKYFFNIIVDTREQKPWVFSDCNTIAKKLDTGDYSIEGLESLLCIERKNSVSEIANNIIEKRFANEIERMQDYLYKYVLLEFNLEDVLLYPIGSSVPKRVWSKIRVKSAYILKFLTDMQIKHDIHVIFCGSASNAEKMAFSIMKRVNEKHG